MTNRQKLEQMFRMQKELDLRIIGDYKDYPLDQQEIALFAELGELMNELPTIFKHWKKSAVDNREKALEELVDCWHFAISLQINKSLNMGREFNYDVECFHRYLNIISQDLDEYKRNLRFIRYLNDICTWHYYYIVHLTYLLGFTFEEVYEGYLKKNAINHQRQDGGY